MVVADIMKMLLCLVTHYFLSTSTPANRGRLGYTGRTGQRLEN